MILIPILLVVVLCLAAALGESKQKTAEVAKEKEKEIETLKLYNDKTVMDSHKLIEEKMSEMHHYIDNKFFKSADFP